MVLCLVAERSECETEIRQHLGFELKQRIWLINSNRLSFDVDFLWPGRRLFLFSSLARSMHHSTINVTFGKCHLIPLLSTCCSPQCTIWWRFFFSHHAKGEEKLPHKQQREWSRKGTWLNDKKAFLWRWFFFHFKLMIERKIWASLMRVHVMNKRGGIIICNYRRTRCLFTKHFYTKEFDCQRDTTTY